MTVRIQFVKDYAVYSGREYRGVDGVGRLCRELVACGHGDECLEAYRGGMLCLTIPNIRDRAEESLQENKRGLHYRRYRPYYNLD